MSLAALYKRTLCTLNCYFIIISVIQGKELEKKGRQLVIIIIILITEILIRNKNAPYEPFSFPLSFVVETVECEVPKI